MKIQLQFESPLLIGGKKHSSNFIETDDVIKAEYIPNVRQICRYENGNIQEYHNLETGIITGWWTNGNVSFVTDNEGNYKCPLGSDSEQWKSYVDLYKKNKSINHHIQRYKK